MGSQLFNDRYEADSVSSATVDRTAGNAAEQTSRMAASGWVRSFAVL